jgi:hypothetical protein
MIEAIGKLIEEPEKRKMYLVFALKMVLTAILTDFIYKKIVGPYILLEPLSGDFYAEIFHFVISGTALIVMLLYFVSGIVLFNILSIFINFVIGVLCSKKLDTPLKDSTYVRLTLSWTQAIKIEAKGNIFSRGKDFESFYNMIIQYRKKSFKKAMEQFKHSLINEIIQLYAVFALMYYVVLDFKAMPFLDIIITVAGVALLLFYIALHNFTRFIDLNENGLYAAVRMLKADEIISELLAKSYLTSNKPEHLRGSSPCALIVSTIAGDILIDYYLSDHLIDGRIEGRMINQRDKMQCVAFIIINCLSAKIHKDVIRDNNIYILEYSSEKNLRTEIMTILNDKRQLPISDIANP